MQLTEQQALALRQAHFTHICYHIGRQLSHVLLQRQDVRGDNYFYSKRVEYWDVDWDEPKHQQLNNRTTLRQELVIDFDAAEFDYDKAKYAAAIFSCYKFLSSNKYPFQFWSSGSKGVHCHAYIESLLHLSDYERKRIKNELIRSFNGDFMLKSEVTTITMEYSANAKTGRYKVPINIFTELEREVFKYWTKQSSYEITILHNDKVVYESKAL